MIDFLVNMFRESVIDDLRWAMFVFVGQLVFAARFPVQWIASERKGESYIPLSFWLLSIVGGVMWVAYAVHIRNFIMMLSVGLAIPIYLRNIQLINKRQKDNKMGNEISLGDRACDAVLLVAYALLVVGAYIWYGLFFRHKCRGQN